MDNLEKSLKEIYLEEKDSTEVLEKYNLEEDDLIYFFLDFKEEIKSITNKDLIKELTKVYKERFEV